MENMTTRDFCRKFRACPGGTRFALKYEKMHECYEALLQGAAAEHSFGWAFWVGLQKGVFSKDAQQKFMIACMAHTGDTRLARCAIMFAKYFKGKLLKEDLPCSPYELHLLDDLEELVWYWVSVSEDVAAWKYFESHKPVDHTLAWAVLKTGCRKAREKQLTILSELGNPFTEAC